MKWGEVRKLESYGQFGDVFGTVNALFTGFALVGLVYTAWLQRHQTATQISQFDLQREEFTSQSREQFLTARLNATVALLQAKQAEISVTPDGGQDHFGLRSTPIRCLAQEIAILRCEARLSENYRTFTWRVELWAIRLYLIDLFQDLHNRYCSVTELSKPHPFLASIQANLTCAEISLLRKNPSSVRWRRGDARQDHLGLAVP